MGRILIILSVLLVLREVTGAGTSTHAPAVAQFVKMNSNEQSQLQPQSHPQASNVISDSETKHKHEDAVKITTNLTGTTINMNKNKSNVVPIVEPAKPPVPLPMPDVDPPKLQNVARSQDISGAADKTLNKTHLSPPLPILPKKDLPDLPDLRSHGFKPGYGIVLLLLVLTYVCNFLI